MHLIPSAVKRPYVLASCLLLGLFSILVAGCDAKKSSATPSPTAREVELTKTVLELRGKLAAAEQAAAQAKAEAAAATEQLQQARAIQTQVTEASLPKPENKIPDTSYVVVKKTFTAGQLIARGTPSNPSATERRPAEFHVTFKGVQSGKEYPELEVQESAYSQFREGFAYPPQAINLAKKSAAAPSGPASSSPTSTGGGTGLSAAEAKAIFGN